MVVAKPEPEPVVETIENEQVDEVQTTETEENNVPVA